MFKCADRHTGSVLDVEATFFWYQESYLNVVIPFWNIWVSFRFVRSCRYYLETLLAVSMQLLAVWIYCQYLAKLITLLWGVMYTNFKTCQKC